MNNESTPKVPTEGRLEDVPLSDILESLSQDGATGTLALDQDSVVKAIFLQKGEIVFATSTKKSDRLGQILLRHGVISDSAHQATTKAMQETGKREGETLVELGVLTPKGLFEGLRLQVDEVIISTFLWDTGRYRFIKGPLPSHVIPLPINLAELLPKAIDRLNPTD
ncbi:MAG: DUF4388 domain-containing protein [Leptospirillia bacterium]